MKKQTQKTHTKNKQTHKQTKGIILTTRKMNNKHQKQQNKQTTIKKQISNNKNIKNTKQPNKKNNNKVYKHKIQ